MAGKKAYLVADEVGHTWVVKVGDPAYELARSLKHPTPVLYMSVLRTGSLEGVDWPRLQKNITRLAQWAHEHGEMEDDLIRLVALTACLHQLRALTIDEAAEGGSLGSD